ncbi:MAG: hypothetical protein QOG87_1706 [Actinomycetota bacterium]|jgi:hypothetical protein
MAATLSPVPLNWAKEAHLTSVRRAIARELRHRTFEDFSGSERYDELVQIERRLMIDAADARDPADAAR